jgi:hypothetical protein
MSALTQDVKCPCGEEFEAELFAAVNAQREPELKDAVLAGQLNVVECSMCRRLIYAERFVLYHDPAAELLAFVYPADFQAEEARWKAKTEEDFAAAASAQKPEERLPYRPMTLFGLDALAARLSKDRWPNCLRRGWPCASCGSNLPSPAPRIYPPCSCWPRRRKTPAGR